MHHFGLFNLLFGYFHAPLFNRSESRLSVTDFCLASSIQSHLWRLMQLATIILPKIFLVHTLSIMAAFFCEHQAKCSYASPLWAYLLWASGEMLNSSKNSIPCGSYLETRTCHCGMKTVTGKNFKNFTWKISCIRNGFSCKLPTKD